MGPNSSRNSDDRSPTYGERLLTAIRDLDAGAKLAGELTVIWRDHDCLLLVAELVGADVQMVTADEVTQVLNVHLRDEVLVLDLSGAGWHKLMCVDVWGISMELNSSLGLDGSAGA